MQENLKDYVKIYRGIISSEICKSTVNDLTSANWQIHQFYSYARDEKISYEKELSVSGDMTSTYKEIAEQCKAGINFYIKNLNSPYYTPTSWVDHSPIRFNKYEIGTQMNSHVDHIHTLFQGTRKGIPTLSLVGLLNDNFEGGDFIMFDNEKIPLCAGDILIFPSIFMYPHGVTEVTKGTRYSFVSWVW